MSRLAVIFPGIGYGNDKPLLYYAARLARRECGMDVVSVEYSRMPRPIQNDPEKMREAVSQALEDAGRCLAGVDIGKYDGVVFISKSLGSVVAGIASQNLPIACENILFTPLIEAFDYIEDGSGIAFHGTEDPWTETEALEAKCEEKGIRLFVIPDADHSLETGDTVADIRILRKAIKKVRKYFNKGESNE